MSTSPIVYFIDDSATMREVIKIAFRRENINVIACHDADSALEMMQQTVPDVVISDVIMPDHDGYEVCQSVKQNPRFGATPVILMSGVVNRSVAEKAFAVKADELIRKPFQPQDLIARVRHLLSGRTAARVGTSVVDAVTTKAAAMAALSSIFQSPVSGRPASPVPLAVVSRQALARSESGIGVAVAARIAGGTLLASGPDEPAARTAHAVADAVQQRVPIVRTPELDLSRQRIEVLRLQSQIKKLEAELRAEREYARALEEHIKTLQEAE